MPTLKPAAELAAAASKPYPNDSAEYRDRKSTRLNSSHLVISYAVLCSHPDHPSLPTRRSSDLLAHGRNDRPKRPQVARGADDFERPIVDDSATTCKRSSPCRP